MPRPTAALSLPTPDERAEALAGLGIGIVVTDRTAPGEAPDVAGRMLTAAGADLTVVAVDGRAQPRSVPASWYVALGGCVVLVRRDRRVAAAAAGSDRAAATARRKHLHEPQPG